MIEIIPNAKIDDNSKKVVAYSCTQDEQELFLRYANQMGIEIVTTSKSISKETIQLSKNCKSISVNHSVHINSKLLNFLWECGVRHICTRTIGFDHIDIGYAKKIGMCIENISYSPDSVADYTIMLLLMMTRNMKSLLKRVDVKNYSIPTNKGKELNQLKVGVIGTGNIGETVIKHLYNFGCTILANDMFVKESIEKYVNYVDFDTLLKESDIITLHLPSNKDNFHMFNDEAFAKMKQGAYIINTSRGSLVDTKSLIKAIEEKKLSGAALDVIENENGVFYQDYRDKPLLHRELDILNSYSNVIVTPHTAFHTQQAVKDMVYYSLEKCYKFQNLQVKNIINK